MAKKVDPVDRALAAVLALDETQRAVFTGVLKRLDKPQVEVKRGVGRPPGSRNRSTNIATGTPAAVLAASQWNPSQGRNAAEGEGL